MTPGIFTRSRLARALVLLPTLLFFVFAPVLVALPGERCEEEQEASKEATEERSEERSEEVEVKAAHRPAHRAMRVRPPPARAAHPRSAAAVRRHVPRPPRAEVGRPAVPTPLLR